MRDSLGGIPILVIVTLFIVIALGYVAYNVNYTKAFRMKNKAVELFEEYSGAEKCLMTENCRKELQDYANKIGYSTGGISCETGYTNFQDLLCYKVKSCDAYSSAEKKSNGIINDGNKGFSNDIYTKINIDIPIIKKFVTSVSYFYVSGSTYCIDGYNGVRE